MTREDVIRMAGEAGVIPIDNPRGMELIWWSISVEELERFADLVAAAKQEECIRTCDRLLGGTFSEKDRGIVSCVNAIRALK